MYNILLELLFNNRDFTIFAMKFDVFHRIIRAMVTIEAIIERAEDGTYCVYCKNDIFSGAGVSIDDAKADMKEQMEFYKKTAIEKGFKYPLFLDQEYQINYTIDAISLMKYYVKAGILSLSGIEKITGINQKQLWSYLNGTKPRKTQSDRIEIGFKKLYEDMYSIFA